MPAMRLHAEHYGQLIYHNTKHENDNIDYLAFSD